MNLLVDNQLPAALARFLADQGYRCRHVSEIGIHVGANLFAPEGIGDAL